MKRIAYLGFSLVVLLVLEVPGFAQQCAPKTRPEYDAYVAFFNEKVPAKRAELAEKYLTDFKDTVPECKASAYQAVVKAYVDSQNWAKALDAAGKVDTMLPNATPQTKAVIYSHGMSAAQQSNNLEKTIEFGDKVLAIAPEDANTLITLSSMIPERLPADAAAKEAALGKAEQYATRAQAQVAKIFGGPKPAGMSDADWNTQHVTIESQLHSTLGFIQLNRMAYEKAVDEYLQTLKATPKDGVAWYRLGLAYNGQASAATKKYLEALKAENDAIAAKADRPQIDEFKAKREALETELRDKRDKAIDALAGAVAVGGTASQPAKDQLSKLYQQKNGSTEGLEELINQKKQQLGGGH
jgi:tetratricopeptide (TPR) repeat protein